MIIYKGAVPRGILDNREPSLDDGGGRKRKESQASSPPQSQSASCEKERTNK